VLLCRYKNSIKYVLSKLFLGRNSYGLNTKNFVNSNVNHGMIQKSNGVIGRKKVYGRLDHYDF